MKITMIGTGYVGLVSGACFSEMGSSVTCVDVDDKKIEALKLGILPIYEPGLEAMVQQNHKEGLLHFSTSLEEAMKLSNLYFIAVGTPPGEDGSADLKYVLKVASEIGKNLETYAVIVDKSTVPVGTADKVRDAVQKELDLRGVDIDFDVVSNPEFLKEGAALADFMKPDRIIVGADTEKARKLMQRVYAPFSRNRDKLLFMSVRDAEMTKYTANSMLATKISFMNEIAAICERLGVDVENVRKGIGSDSRIGYSFIYPGCGYGGSCFPKDIKALIRTSVDCGLEPGVLNAVEERNTEQKRILPEKIGSRLGKDLSGFCFGVWGLAFKPGTDDMREASSIVLIESLVQAGAVVKAYDPVAMEEAKKVFPREMFDQGSLVLTDQPYDALDRADAMVLVTEWKTFRQPDFEMMKEIMRSPLIFDGRNQYDPQMVKEAGFEYFGIGR